MVNVQDMTKSDVLPKIQDLHPFDRTSNSMKNAAIADDPDDDNEEIMMIRSSTLSKDLEQDKWGELVIMENI